MDETTRLIRMITKLERERQEWRDRCKCSDAERDGALARVASLVVDVSRLERDLIQERQAKWPVPTTEPRE